MKRAQIKRVGKPKSSSGQRMLGSRKRAGFVVAAVTCCSLLVAACLSFFTAHSARPLPIAAAKNALPPTVRIVEHNEPSQQRAVYVSMPETRLTSRHTSLRWRSTARRAEALQSQSQIPNIATEEAQLRRIAADVEGRAQVASGRASAAPVPPAAPPQILSQSQIDAAVQKLSSGKVAAAKGLASAIERMNKLREEEHDLHKELGAVLGKITSMNIVTSEKISVPDGLGGDQMQVVVARPVGGKASAAVIKTDDGAVSAAKEVAASGQGFIHKDSAPFPSHDAAAGNDGLGGSQTPIASEAAVQPLLPVKMGKGLAPEVRGDDGLGGRILSAAATSTNAGSSTSPFRPNDKRMDGVGGSGKRLFHRRSNKHLTKAKVMKKVLHNDGVGGDVRFRESRNLRKVPRNHIHKWARDCGDGLGGKAIWCDRMMTAFAVAKGASSSASSGAKASIAAVKAALIARDAAAKDRAGFVPHHRLSKTNGGQASQGDQIDNGGGDDDDDDQDGGSFGGFGGRGFGYGNFAGDGNADGSEGGFSSDNQDGSFGSYSGQDSGSGDQAADSSRTFEQSAGGSVSNADRAPSSGRHRGARLGGSNGASEQDGQDDGAGSGSVGEFQDQDRSQSADDMSSASVGSASSVEHDDSIASS
jgi:hypothetical protein